MKPYERRAAGEYPFFKLAVWDHLSAVWKFEDKRPFPTESAAVAAASKPGKYRLTRVDDGGKIDSEPFTIP